MEELDPTLIDLPPIRRSSAGGRAGNWPGSALRRGHPHCAGLRVVVQVDEVALDTPCRK